MKKTKSKKSTKCSDDKIKEKVHEVADELGGLIKKAKAKYDQADEKTKKKVIAGIAGAGALLAGIIGAKAIKKKRKK
jgi:hypothetical protein